MSEAAGPILLEGLQRLEYRGYDSSGIAILDRDGVLAVMKRAGQGELAALAAAGGPPDGQIGIGHTRWATHGGVSDRNAHPHVSSAGDVIVVQNGIVENYRALREELTAAGAEFVSETDTEVIPQLISQRLREAGDMASALRAAMAAISGGNSVVALKASEPDRLYAARKGNAGGIVIGFGEEEMYVGSDMPALIPHTNRVRYLKDGEVASIAAGDVRIWDAAGELVNAEPEEIPLDPVAVAKGPYKHFMQKEIFEQPRALSDTIRGRAHLDPPGVVLEDLPFDDEALRQLRRVLIIGMGTSMHAAMVGRAFMERLGGIPADYDNSSEFRYRAPLLGPETLVISISQSGETVDTLGAMHHVREVWGAPQVTICNVVGAESTRVARGSALYLRCGPEIGVRVDKDVHRLHGGALSAGLSDRDGPRGAGGCGPRTRARVSLGRSFAYRRHVAAIGSLRSDRPALSRQPEPALPGTWRAVPDRDGGRTEVQRDLLHPRRGVPRWGNEARADRPD